MTADTPVTLTAGLRFPVKLLARLVDEGASVRQGQPLFTYTEEPLPSTSDVKGKGRATADVRSFLSPLEGELGSWAAAVGASVRDARQTVLSIREPCLHPIQLGGLCGVCGKDLTANDFTRTAEASRAGIRMSHDKAGLTVSLEEASRLERDTAERLRRSQKLSLIVDLDQTIIHATVDPTVGDWMADPGNPNHAALADVSRFQLPPDPSQPQHLATEADSCWYYVKPRPGLREFLRECAQLYEMHVYTMGTRTYADEICKIIDPDGALFGERVLSRDESGSMTQKSLTRLFPCDTSMVVVIDDRGDVWDWSSNLLKVVPYDFFVGIGDINATFLPAKTGLDAASPSPAGPSPSSDPVQDIENVAGVEATPAQSEAIRVADEAHDHALVEQIHDRPLAKKQEALQAQAATPSLKGTERAVDQDDVEVTIARPPTPRMPTRALPDGVARSAEVDGESEAVLKDEDQELPRLLGLLRQVHRDFYAAKGGTGDVKDIIPALKRQVLAGVHLLFSGVIPLDVEPRRAGIWIAAESFGAVCSTRLEPSTTHVVSAKPDTAKVNAARRRSDIHIVWTQWLLDSMSLWRQLDVATYLHAPPTSHASTPGSPSSRGSPPPGATDDIPFPPTSGRTESYEMDIETQRGISTMDWADADRELEEALEDDDTDDGRSHASADPSELGTDDDTAGPSRGAKRPPPSPSSSTAAADEDASPLVKRRRVAAGRRSKLKVTFRPDGPSSDPAAPVASASRASLGSELRSSSVDDDDDDDDLAGMAGLIDSHFD